MAFDTTAWTLDPTARAVDVALRSVAVAVILDLEDGLAAALSTPAACAVEHPRSAMIQGA